MNRIVEGLIVFVAIVLIILGAIFLIAGGAQNIMTGAVLVLLAVVLLFYNYRSQKIQAAKPTLVTQNFNVKMEGTGQTERKELKCRSCGATLSEKDIKVVQGGVVITCPYCGTVTTLEESPKW
ncbi:MAG: hypothetical protein A4E32_00824 [Methanomassiliicoccales archaeon PtaU1.Bin124]|nr:MAG: hypothetical protein A4E32_00824 [Methanomassiliicoccales archaeon PtaU1.Bin124]